MTTQTPVTGNESTAEAAGTGTVRRTVLPSGLHVVTEAIPTVRSVAFGAWVRVGSRDEPAGLRGASHFLEHLLFKGTTRRSGLDIARALDAVGGESNAITTKEFTCFYIRVRDVDLPLATDLICDMLTSARLDPGDVESERRVILGELAMYEDDPGHVTQNLFAGTIFADHPLGRPAAGDNASITALTRDDIAAFYASRYRPDNIVIAAAGNVEHDRVVELVSSWWSSEMSADGHSPLRARARAAASEPRVRVLRRPTEQANVLFGVPGVNHTDDRRYALTALGTALGGGLSARLFQEIRERRGLAYAVGSYVVSYADTGVFAVYAVCNPGNTDEVVSTFRRELADVAQNGVTEDELDRARGQMAGKFVLGQEDTLSRLGRLTQGELFEGELPPVSEVLRRINGVTVDDVREVGADLLTAAPTLAVVGPFDEDRTF